MKANLLYFSMLQLISLKINKKSTILAEKALKNMEKMKSPPSRYLFMAINYFPGATL